MDFAAMNGHLEVLKWLHQNGKTCTANTIYRAANNGFLKVVEFLQSI